MDRQDFNEFIKSLDIKNLNVEQEYEYDEPSNILILQPVKPLNVVVESTHGFMSFIVEEFQFDATHQRLSLMFEGFEIYRAPLRNIVGISHSIVSPEDLAYEHDKAASYEAMYGIEYGSYLR